MSIRVKFNLLLVAIFLLSLVGAAWYYHHALESDAISDVRQDSQVLMETALAIRSYTTDEIKPISTRSTTSASCRRRCGIRRHRDLASPA